MSEFRLVAAVFDEAQSATRRGAHVLDALSAGLDAVKSNPYYAELRGRSSAQVLFDEAHIPMGAQASAPAPAEPTASAGGPAPAEASGAETLADEPVPADAAPEVRLLMSRVLEDGTIIHVFSGNPPRTCAEQAHVDSMLEVANRTLEEHGRDGSNAGLEFTMTSAPDGEGLSLSNEPLRTEISVLNPLGKGPILESRLIGDGTHALHILADDVVMPHGELDALVERANEHLRGLGHTVLSHGMRGRLDSERPEVAAAEHHVPGRFSVQVPQVAADGSVTFVSAGEADTMEAAIALGEAAYDGIDTDALIAAVHSGAVEKALADMGAVELGGSLDDPLSEVMAKIKALVPDVAPPSVRHVLSALAGTDGHHRRMAAADLGLAGMGTALPGDAAFMQVLGDLIDGLLKRHAPDTSIAERNAAVADASLSPFDAKRRLAFPTVDAEQAYDVARNAAALSCLNNLRSALQMLDLPPTFELSKQGQDRILSRGVHDRYGNGEDSPDLKSDCRVLDHTRARAAAPAPAAPASVTHISEPQRRMLNAYWALNRGPLMSEAERLKGFRPIFSHRQILEAFATGEPLPGYGGVRAKDPRGATLPLLSSLKFADSSEPVKASDVHLGAWPGMPDRETVLHESDVEEAAAAEGFGLGTEAPIEEPDLAADAAGYAEERVMHDHAKALVALNVARSMVGMEAFPAGSALSRYVVDGILSGKPFNRYGLPLRADRATDSVGMITSMPAWTAALGEAMKNDAVREHEVAIQPKLLDALKAWSQKSMGEAFPTSESGMVLHTLRKQVQVDEILSEAGSKRTFKVSCSLEEGGGGVLRLEETTPEELGLHDGAARMVTSGDASGEKSRTMHPVGEPEPIRFVLEDVDAAAVRAAFGLDDSAPESAAPAVVNLEAVCKAAGADLHAVLGDVLVGQPDFELVTMRAKLPRSLSTQVQGKPWDALGAIVQHFQPFPAAQAKVTAEGVKGDANPGAEVLEATGEEMVTLRLPWSIAAEVLGNMEGAKAALSRAVLGGDLDKAAERMVLGDHVHTGVKPPYWDDAEGIALAVINPIRHRYGGLEAYRELAGSMVANILSGEPFTLYGDDAPSGALDRCAAFTSRPHVAVLLQVIRDLVRDWNWVRQGEKFEGDHSEMIARRILNGIRARYGFEAIRHIEDSVVVGRILSGRPFDREGFHADFGRDAVSEFTSRPHVQGLLRVIADLYGAVFGPAPKAEASTSVFAPAPKVEQRADGAFTVGEKTPALQALDDAPVILDMSKPGPRAMALRELNQQRRENAPVVGGKQVEVIDLTELPDWADVEKLVIKAWKRAGKTGGEPAFEGAPFTGQAWVNAINDFLLQADGTIAPLASEGGAA